MLRVKAGDDSAFAELVSQFQDRVIGLLYHLLGNADEAEDLAQEVFLRVYRSRERYEPTAKFSTWLFTIVNNIARNAIRDRRRRRERETLDVNRSDVRPLENMAVAPSGAMPSRIFARGELTEVVRSAVSALSEDQRIALMLNKFEHMNYRQVAEVLGRSETAVKSLLARARAVLRDILQGYVEGSGPMVTLPPDDQEQDEENESAQ